MVSFKVLASDYCPKQNQSREGDKDAGDNVSGACERLSDITLIAAEGKSSSALGECGNLLVAVTKVAWTFLLKLLRRRGQWCWGKRERCLTRVGDVGKRIPYNFARRQVVVCNEYKA